MIKCVFLLYVLIYLIQSHKGKPESDSCKGFMIDTLKPEKNGLLYLTSRFKQLNNYHDDTSLDLEFSVKLNMARKKTGKFTRSKQELISEISFTKFIDSLTVVDEDLIEFTSNWEFKFKSVLNTINLKIKSQFTNSYEYIYYNNSFTRILAKEFFLPMTISIGTGFNYTFDKTSFVNFSLAEINTTLLSRSKGAHNPEAQKITDKLYQIPQVGLSVSASVYKSWSKDLFSWRNNSKIFAKGLTKKDININFKNRLMYEIYKWINISLENQIVYDPLYNYKLQMRSEVVLGVLFKK